MALVSQRGKGNLSVPERMTDVPAWVNLIAAKVNQILRGKTNNVSTFTLDVNSSTTSMTVAVGTFGENTVFCIEPTSATAAVAFGSGSFYVSNRDPSTGTYTINHPNTAETDKTFRIAYIG